MPIPNAAEWELKCQRSGTSSLTTLFHLEPSPRALRFVPKMLLPLYGWRHELASIRYPPNEMSFRQTISGSMRTDRGFQIVVDRASSQIRVSFDASAVDPRHSEWLHAVATRIGLGELIPQPYWAFTDLYHKAGTKLLNCFYVTAEAKREAGKELFHYNRILVLRDFDFEKFLAAIEKGFLLVDFDARTGHNHGTKFRLRQDKLPELYGHAEEVC